MFDIGWSELLLIGAVALIAIGPKELPGALRTLGQWVTKMRRMATEFQDQFKEAMREAEFADIKKEVDDMAAKAQSYARFDPIDDIRRDLETAAAPPPELNGPVSARPDAAVPAPDSTASATSDGATSDGVTEPAAIASGPTAGLEPIPEPSSGSVSAEPLPAPAEQATADKTAIGVDPDIAKPDAGRAA